MSLLEKFNECYRQDGYRTAAGEIDFKRVGDTLYWECSDGDLDWVKNFLAVPVPIRIHGRWYSFPLGVAMDSGRVRKICENIGAVKDTVGYSRGGWYACMAALLLKIPAFTFGCPGVVHKPGRVEKQIMNQLITHYENPGDIVCKVPPKFSKPGAIVILTKPYQVQISDTVDRIMMATGHTPQEYRARLS